MWVGLLAAATRRSIGRAWLAAATICGHRPMGSTDELEELVDEHADDFSMLTPGERNLVARGPLLCCTAENADKKLS